MFDGLPTSTRCQLLNYNNLISGTRFLFGIYLFTCLFDRPQIHETLLQKIYNVDAIYFATLVLD